MPKRGRPRLRQIPAMVEMGERLKELRGARSQTEVAAEAGISRGYLSELEQGKRPGPRPRTLGRLAAALHTTLEALRPPPAPHAGQEGEGAGREGEGAQRADVHNATVLPPPKAEPAALTFRVYRWGTWGDPTDPLDAPAPLALEWVPRGSESVIGQDGFSIIVRGDGLNGWRVKDGDQCVINPARAVRVGHLVAAFIIAENGEENGEGGMGVYELADGPPDAAGAPTTVLRSWPERNRPVIVPARHFRVLGPVVQIVSLRSPDEGRPRRIEADELERGRYAPDQPPGGGPGIDRGADFLSIRPPVEPPPSRAVTIAEGVLQAPFPDMWLLPAS